MSRFLCVFDPDPHGLAETRARACGPSQGFGHHHLTEHSFEQAWLGAWTFRTAPQWFARDATGRTAWVLGWPDSCLAADAPADVLLQRYGESGIASLANETGFFVTMLAEPARAWFVADQLGLFPVYYADASGCVWVASSPALILADSRLPRELDMRGLVGQLLIFHEALNQSLWQGIRRLPAGHGLCVEAGRTRVARLASLPVGDGGFGLPANAQIELFNDALAETFRPMKGRTWSVLLSGGLDSRMVSAFLHEAAPAGVEALTLGARRDIEVQCAAKVARHLGWPARRINVPLQTIPEDARRQISEEHLAFGLNDVSWWRLVEAPVTASKGLLTGFLGDSVVGGSHVSWAYDPVRRQFSFDAMLERAVAWGLSPRTLRSILLPRWHSLVDDVIEGLRRQFEEFDGAPFQQAWSFDLANRQRYHVAGGARRISHTVWPLLPLADRRILVCAGNMPANPLMFRQLQRQLFIQRFPALARLKFDTNSYRPRALLENLPARIIECSAGVVAARWRKRVRRECRYYYRVYDFNNAGWRALRRTVHCDLPELEPVFDLGALKQAIGDPNRPVHYAHPIPDVSGPKTLLGVCLLLESLNARM